MDNVLKYNSKILVKGNKILTKTPIISKSPDDLNAFAWYNTGTTQTIISGRISQWFSSRDDYPLIQNTSTLRPWRQLGSQDFRGGQWMETATFPTSLIDDLNISIVSVYNITRNPSEAGTNFNRKHCISSFVGSTASYFLMEQNDWYSAAKAYNVFYTVTFVNSNLTPANAYGFDNALKKKIMISTYNGTTARTILLVDGVPDFVSDTSREISQSSRTISSLYVGRRSSVTQNMVGYVDDTSFYNRALDTSEINFLIKFLSNKYNLTVGYL